MFKQESGRTHTYTEEAEDSTSIISMIDQLSPQVRSPKISALLASMREEEELESMNTHRQQQQAGTTISDDRIMTEEELILDDKVMEISAILPSLELLAIQRALELCNGEITRAIDLLLSGVDLVGRDRIDGHGRNVSDDPQVSAASNTVQSQIGHTTDATLHVDSSCNGDGDMGRILMDIPAVQQVLKAEEEYLKLMIRADKLQKQNMVRSSSSVVAKDHRIRMEQNFLTRTMEEIQLAQKSRFYCKGEEDVLRGKKQHRYVLHPTFKFDMRGEEIHFHIASSQFHRTSAHSRFRSSFQSMEVESVEYVVTPEFIVRFESAKQRLAAKYDWLPESIKPVLLFHGTREENIEPILKTGFLLSKVGSSTDMGYYGRGLYFSEWPHLSIQYSRDSRRLFLCLVIVGKAFRMDKVVTGCPLTDGYDSHISPDGSEVVIFDTDCIMPLYVVKWTSI